MLFFLFPVKARHIVMLNGLIAYFCRHRPRIIHTIRFLAPFVHRNDLKHPCDGQCDQISRNTCIGGIGDGTRQRIG